MVVLMLCYFIRIIDPTSSLGRICLGENIYGSSSEKVERHGDWNAPEYTDMASSKENKVTKALSFYKIETNKVSERYITPCFMNGLEAYDGEINLAFNENLISNEYVVKLCLDYKVRKGNKVVKKELIVALKGELYFVKFIINSKEDDVEPELFLEEDPFEDDFEKTKKSMDDWDQLLDLNFDDIPQLDGEELPLFALRISQKFALLEEVRPVLETMAYHDKYKKVLDEIWKDKVELDGMIVKEEDEVIKESDSDDEEEYEIKRNKFGAAIYGLKPAAYLNCNDLAERLLPLQAVINPFRKISVWKKAVSFLGSLHVPLQHVNWKPDYKGCYTNEEEAKGKWRTEIRVTDPYGNIFDQGFITKKTDRILSKYHKLSDIMSPNLWEETMMKPDHQDPNALDNEKSWKRLGLYHFGELDEDGFDVYFQGGLRSDDHFNAQECWLSISQEENLSLSRSHASTIRNLILRVMHKMITMACVRGLLGLDMTTLRKFIDSEGRLIPEDPQPGVSRVGIPRPPRASMQDFMRGWVIWRYARGRLRGCPIGSRIIGTGCNHAGGTKFRPKVVEELYY
nr:hypothetical protein [Tanacetum cinerariifolium]